MKKMTRYAMALCLTVTLLESHGAEYSPDPAHTSVGFTVRHMGLVNVQGQFGAFEGRLEYDGTDVSSLKVNAVVQTVSINTANAKRDAHLQSKDFFDVETYPEIHFDSSRVEQRGDRAILIGTLKIKDVTKEVEFEVTIAGPITDPWDAQRIGVSLSGVIARHDFGVGFDGMPDKMVSDDVQIQVDIEAIQK